MRSPDVIVIGSGISGLNFALTCAENGLRVLIVTKKRAFESSTNFAQGGIAAVLSQTDNIEKHLHDTLAAGSFHGKRRAIRFMVTHSRDAVLRLLRFGVPFATREGELLLTREGGHGERRIAFVGDYTGKAIEHALVKQVKKNPLITIVQHALATDLLVTHNTCYGVRIIHDNSVKNLYAPATVLATGGLGQLFTHTTNPEIATGDGYAMALRAGLVLRDMEFIQFHPTALAMPRTRMFLLTEALRGEGAVLRSASGERFMPRYSPQKELAPRDAVSRAVFQELKKGPAYLDMRNTHMAELSTRFPTIYQTLKNQYGIDLAHDLVPIAPAAHFCCGGIPTDLHGRTVIKNLFAFGEVAYTGVHGANRLASNSLLEALVFSSMIAEEIVRGPMRNAKLSTRHITHPRFPAQRIKELSPQEKRRMTRILKRAKKIMWENVGLMREKKGLHEAITELSQLQKLIPETFNTQTVETHNMLETAIVIAKSAAARRDVLGCHFRVN